MNKDKFKIIDRLSDVLIKAAGIFFKENIEYECCHSDVMDIIVSGHLTSMLTFMSFSCGDNKDFNKKLDDFKNALTKSISELEFIQNVTVKEQS